MRKFVSTSVAIIALAVSAVAFAEAKTDATAKISYDVPAGFKATTQNNMVMLEEPKGEIAFLLVRSDDADPQKALQDTGTVIDQIVKDVKMVGQPAQIKQNGMDAVQMRATGTHNGKPANVATLVIKAPNGKAFIVVGIVEADKKDAWAKTFKSFIESIKPAK